RTGKRVGKFERDVPYCTFVFSPDGKKLLGHNQVRSIQVWSVPDGTVLNRIEADVPALATAAFTRDGGAILVGGQTGNEAVRIDLATEKEAGRCRMRAGVALLALAPDGWLLAAADAHGVV